MTNATIRTIITLHEQADTLESAFILLDKWSQFSELSDQLKAEHNRIVRIIKKAEKDLPTWYN